MNSQFFYKIMSSFYDLLDVIYFRNYETSPRKVVLESVCPSDKVLDLCTGTGTNAVAIAKKYPSLKIAGVDISNDMLIIARSKIKEEQLKNAYLYNMDATAMRFRSNTFDKVLLSLVLHETDEELADAIVSEAVRVMKPDGRLIITEWERPRSLLQKIVFLPIELLEPKPYRSFIVKDLNEYFSRFGLTIDNTYHCDYSKVLLLKKSV